MKGRRKGAYNLFLSEKNYFFKTTTTCFRCATKTFVNNRVRRTTAPQTQKTSTSEGKHKLSASMLGEIE